MRDLSKNKMQTHRECIEILVYKQHMCLNIWSCSSVLSDNLIPVIPNKKQLIIIYYSRIDTRLMQTLETCKCCRLPLWVLHKMTSSSSKPQYYLNKNSQKRRIITHKREDFSRYDFCRLADCCSTTDLFRHIRGNGGDKHTELQ